jgi:hypothetical protein
LKSFLIPEGKYNLAEMLCNCGVIIGVIRECSVQFNTKVFTVQTCMRKKSYKMGVIKPFRWLTAK